MNVTTLLERLAVILKERKLSLVTAESCTGGWLSQVITMSPSCSQWFDRGFVTYSDVAKQEVLDINPQTIKTYGAVSEQVVRQMVEGSLRHSHAQISLAITGLAGPDTDESGKAVGLVWFGWSIGNFIEAKHSKFEGKRSLICAQAVKFSLKHLIQLLEKNKL